jgi:hypothetical protein
VAIATTVTCDLCGVEASLRDAYPSLMSRRTDPLHGLRYAATGGATYGGLWVHVAAFTDEEDDEDDLDLDFCSQRHVDLYREQLYRPRGG